ncbi:phosphatidylinositol-glycan biosynthesis class X protein [Macrosteles quadrilineatus]|uniref:phosphatidylinositol-glycan biosynthesis class X protein n=1 Tax=Macrosteles quadrilineatus TaxID=74068 RepID=UPI0023E15E1D|nr:phosphatidylinositol-glycan biosynthesis class X protein [Macrosteles quadrilineatus]
MSPGLFLIVCSSCLALLNTVGLCEGRKNNDLCDFHVTVLRQLENDGFHREIHSLVELMGGYGIIQRQHCSLALRETLPAGMYVSPDQLDDLARLGQVQACANSSVDTEAPEPASAPISVMVYSGLERAENLLSARLSLPVHARYHAPSDDGGYQTISMGSPDVLIRCAGPLNCPELNTFSLPCYACSEEICTWTQLPYKTNAENLYMQVPVGNLQHYILVTILTFTITTGGAVYILSVMANSATNIL